MVPQQARALTGTGEHSLSLHLRIVDAYLKTGESTPGWLDISHSVTQMQPAVPFTVLPSHNCTFIIAISLSRSSL